MPPYTIPYAPSRLYDYGPSRTLGELMRLRAEQQAEGIRQQGNISGQMWQNVGSTIGNTLGQLAQYKLDAPQREFEAAKLRAVQREARDVQQAKDIQRLALTPNEQGILTYDRDLLTREFTAAGIGDRLPGLLKSLDDADSAALGLKEAQQKFARQGLDALLNGVEAGGSTPQAFKAAAEYGVANKLFSRAQAQQFVARAEAEPASIPKMIAALRGEKPKIAEPFTLTPGGARFDASGRQIASVPATAPTPSYQAKEVLLDGRPVMATFDAHTGRYVVNGQDVTARVQPIPPREPQGPQTPVAIIGPDGKPIFTTAAGAIGKTPASTREQGRPVTSGDAGRIAEFDTALDDLDVLRGTIAPHDPTTGALIETGATGTAAKAAAALPNWVTEWTGIGATPKSKQAVIDRVKQVIGKALEGGVLRKEDEYKYEKILPTLGDVVSVVESKLNGLENAIRQRRVRLIESLADAGYETARYQLGATPNEDTRRNQPPPGPTTPKRGEERIVNGQTYVWRTINGQSGWMKK